MIVFAMSVGIYLGFVMKEGKDERGQSILGKSSQLGFIFIFLGFVFQSIYITYASPSVADIQLMIVIWITIVSVCNSAGILYFKKSM